MGRTPKGLCSVNIYSFLIGGWGRPLPGNRFVSFVRAYARCPLPSGNEPKFGRGLFPFSLSAREAFPFPSPPPNPPSQLRLALSVDLIH